MLVKLKSVGVLVGTDSGVAAMESGVESRWIERRGLLVYVGEFESADGPVSVTAEKLALLVAMHNARVAASQPVGNYLKECPPVQKDHSTAADDTVGRLVGPIELGFHIPSGQTEPVPAVFGTLRFIGDENCLKVQDGRWTHLSIGADFEKGSVSEVSVVPFPAASDASLLSAQPKPDGQGGGGTVKLSTASTERDGAMDKTKLKAYLMSAKGMSESEADQHLAKCETDGAELSKLSGEADEHEKKLSAEKTEADEKKKEEQESKLAAARGQITTLAAGFRSNVDTAKLAAKKGKIVTRLSRLRAAAKITPAEVKKIDIAKLAGESDSAVELVLKTYEDREPVIHVGQLGSVKATDVSAHTSTVRMSRLEHETRQNMSLLKSKDGATTKLAGGAAAKAVVIEEAPVDEAALDKECGEIGAMIDAGKGADAKVRLKGLVRRAMVGGAAVDGLEAHASDTEAQLAALADTITKMEAAYGELAKLAGSLAGVTTT